MVNMGRVLICVPRTQQNADQIWKEMSKMKKRVLLLCILTILFSAGMEGCPDLDPMNYVVFTVNATYKFTSPMRSTAAMLYGISVHMGRSYRSVFRRLEGNSVLKQSRLEWMATPLWIVHIMCTKSNLSRYPQQYWPYRRKYMIGD